MSDFTAISPEQRQHISLSDRAYNVILSDSFAFTGAQNISGIINKIALLTYERSSANIASERDRIISSYTETLEHINSIDERMRAEAAGILAEKDLSCIKERILSYKKDHPLKIRLNNDLYSLLYEDDLFDWTCGGFYKNQGSFIKALIEEYSSLPLSERERIYFSEILDILDSMIYAEKGHKRIACITLRTTSGKKQRFLVKPYSVIKDDLDTYNYLVCMSSIYPEKTEFVPTSFRISRIESIAIRSESFGSGKITQKEQDLIELKISENGVQYMIGNTNDRIVVSLSSEGIRRYNALQRNRPRAVSIVQNDDRFLYSFDCTLLQAEIYFFEFGSACEVLEPVALRDKFKNGYIGAAGVYNS